MAETEEKWPVGGYAPGGYLCTCGLCKEKFQGDKRAFQCLPCARKVVAAHEAEALAVAMAVCGQEWWNTAADISRQVAVECAAKHIQALNAYRVGRMFTNLT